MPEAIELLDIMEVTGSTLEKPHREFWFPLPTASPIRSNTAFLRLTPHNFQPFHAPSKSIFPVLLDPIAKQRKGFTPAKPLKMERPLYPRLAREQGWQGNVLLRVQITAVGRVRNVTIQKSSGVSILDESAVQAVQAWTFDPAKNGEFQVPSLAYVPIRFDLLQ